MYRNATAKKRYHKSRANNKQDVGASLIIKYLYKAVINYIKIRTCALILRYVGTDICKLRNVIKNQ